MRIGVISDTHGLVLAAIDVRTSSFFAKHATSRAP